MSGSQRMAKTRARTLPFPDKEAAAREQDTGRMAALRAAYRESERQSTQSVATLWWALDPDVLAESRVLAETLGIADENLLLGDWASRSRFRRLASWLTFSRETLGWQMPLVHSPAQCKPGILVRCLSICDPNDAPPLSRVC